jgi:hypothetical protein
VVWSAAKINYLMLLRELIANRTKHAKALCGQNGRVQYVKAGRTNRAAGHQKVK